MSPALLDLEPRIKHRVLRRLKKLARKNGDLIKMIRGDGTFYLLDGEKNALVWPNSMLALGSGASLTELRDYLEGGVR
jgi:hypothetical protein